MPGRREPGRSADELLGSAAAAWIGWVIRAPKLVLAVATLLTIGSTWLTVERLGIDTDPSGLFAEDLPFRRNRDALERAFPQFSDTLVILLDGDPPLSVERAARELTERLDPEQFASVFWPQGDPFFARHGLLYLPVERLQEILAPLAQMAPLLRHLEAAPELPRLADTLARAIPLAGTPLPPQLAAICDGLSLALEAASRGETTSFDWASALTSLERPTRQLVIAQPRRDYGSFLPSGPAIESVRAIASELDFVGRGIEMTLTGDVALGHDELQEAGGGAAIAGLLSLLLVATFLMVGLRSKRLVLAALVTLFYGLVWTAGWAALSVGHLNLISVAFAVLYISLGVDFSIHLGLRFRELQSRGQDDAIARAARDVGGSLLLAALTTSLGFAAFVPTDFTGVAELGVIAGGGMLISLAANLTVLPALVSLHGLRSDTAPNDAGSPVARFLEFVRAHASGTRRTALAIGAAAICALPWMRFDANPLNLRNPSSESVRGFHELAATPDTTPYGVSILTEDAAEAARLATALEALPLVANTRRLADFVPDQQETKLDEIERARAAIGPPPKRESRRDSSDAPAALRALLMVTKDDDALARLSHAIGTLLAAVETLDPNAAANRLALAERGVLDDLPAALTSLRLALAADPVVESTLPADLRSRWRTEDGMQRVEARPAHDLSKPNALQRFATAVLAIAPDASGGPVIVTESARVASASFRAAFAWALGAMAVLLLLALRSARDVVLIMIPLGLAGVITVAALTLAGVPFNFANVIGLPLLLGMSVDNGIHVVHRFRVDPDAAGAALLRTSTARAVLFSSLTTLGGFGTLMISQHPGTASLGLLLATGILANLTCTLVLLPVLLSKRT